jgi:deoxyribodipyrimidine photo-lyase
MPSATRAAFSLITDGSHFPLQLKQERTMAQTNIWWIRRDIRLQDNPALVAALQNADQLIPLFIIEPDLMTKAAPKRRAFLLDALAGLDRELHESGSCLVVRQGPAAQALRNLVSELGNMAIHAQEDFSPFSSRRDEKTAQTYDLRLHPGVVLRHPTEVLKSNGEPYTVYTPYMKRWMNTPLPSPADCLSAPVRLPPVPDGLPTGTLPAAQPAPGFPATVGEAQARLTAFTRDSIRRYKSERDRLDLEGTSLLSPYLRFGLVSVRQAFAQSLVALLKAKDERIRAEVRAWVNELVWREFYAMILYHFPRVMTGPFRKEYQGIRWRDALEDLKAWQQGLTGYPIVDACMRQLLETGWMHNRGRMIVASFLTKDLLINWQEGESWFMDNLIDGDPAANNGGWQWTAGTGTDAAPYFRIFNPVLQGQKFDPEGAFITRWVPELGSLPARFRHEPWKLPDGQALELNFQLGRDYPIRLVNHKSARQHTLDAYQDARNNP